MIAIDGLGMKDKALLTSSSMNKFGIIRNDEIGM
jgi:hypothetical protein